LLFDFTPPPMPQNFTAGNVTGHTIDLFWELNHPDAAQIQILMNTTAGASTEWRGLRRRPPTISG
ncbi:hypothetical protein B6U83_05390, partial [Thermoplasmatales archaeon ex4484_36]